MNADLSYTNNSTKKIRRPASIVCYICGREYGTRSLEIHIKTCEKKWGYEQAKLPAKKRKPCPQAPRGFANMLRMAQGKKPLAEDQDVGVGEYNDAMNKAVGGSGEGGKSMGKMTAAEVMQQYNDDAYKNWDVNILEPCPHCNRTFLPEKLPIHLRACKKDKPLKRPIIRGDDPQEEEEKVPMLGLAAREAAELKKGQFGPGGKIKSGGLSEYEQAEADAKKAKLEAKKLAEKEAKKAKWKQGREDFINSIRAGREMAKLEKELKESEDQTENFVIQQKLKTLADQAPSTMDNADLVQCPHCSRKFNKNAADRHIPICANNVHKPKAAPSKEQVSKNMADRKEMYLSPKKSMRKPLQQQTESMDHSFTIGSNDPNFLGISPQPQSQLARKTSPRKSSYRTTFNPNLNQTVIPDEPYLQDKDSGQNFGYQTLQSQGENNFTFGQTKKSQMAKDAPSLIERTSAFNNVQCPHCLRKFAKKPAERHIPICPQKDKNEQAAFSQNSASPNVSKSANLRGTKNNFRSTRLEKPEVKKAVMGANRSARSPAKKAQGAIPKVTSFDNQEVPQPMTLPQSMPQPQAQNFSMGPPNPVAGAPNAQEQFNQYQQFQQFQQFLQFQKMMGGNQQQQQPAQDDMASQMQQFQMMQQMQQMQQQQPPQNPGAPQTLQIPQAQQQPPKIEVDDVDNEGQLQPSNPSAPIQPQFRIDPNQAYRF